MKHECDFSDMAGANPVCRDLAPEPEPLHTLMSMVTDWLWRANRPWREPTAVEQAARVTFTPEYITRHVTATIDVCRALRGRNPLVDMLDKMERGTYTPPVTDGKAYALKNVPPCPECGKYSFHQIDCEQAKKMDVRFRNYILKSWEPDAVPESRSPLTKEQSPHGSDTPQLCTCDASLLLMARRLQDKVAWSIKAPKST